MLLFEHFSHINILLQFCHLRNIDEETTVFKLIEQHLFRLFLFQKISGIHNSVSVDILGDSDRVFSSLQIWERQRAVLIDDI